MLAAIKRALLCCLLVGTAFGGDEQEADRAAEVRQRVEEEIELLSGAALDKEEQAEKLGWYRGEGIVPIVHITPEEALEKAWDLARKNVVDQASVEVVGLTSARFQESSTGENYDHFVEFVRTVSRGRIVAADTLFDGHEQRTIPGTQRRELVYRVSLQARVEPEVGIADPGFVVDLSLNQEVFHHGEELVLKVRATRDCYITVLNLFSNDSLVVVLPNKRIADNRLKAGVSRRLPPEGAGWDMPVWLAPGREYDEEVLMVVAIRERVPFSLPQGREREGLQAFGEALLAIDKWLIDIPAGQRTQAMVSYRITK